MAVELNNLIIILLSCFKNFMDLKLNQHRLKTTENITLVAGLYYMLTKFQECIRPIILIVSNFTFSLYLFLLIFFR